ncbi:MOP flippase family protein [Thalassobellus citreus]|uniref:MOP flippase family protein n=1 Tax=Thalassobellus citreus TaxID=3367752 RepID=UPI0037B03816
MNLKSKSVSGVKWMSVSTIFVAVSAVLKASILTRLLNVADFGLMAIVTFILGFITLFIDLGLTTAILHVDKISKSEYASLFWLNIGFSILLFLILLLISPFVSLAYNETELELLIPLMASGLVFNALGSQFRTIEQKKLNFKLLAIVDIVSSAFSLILAILLALLEFGVYALVYSSLFYTISGGLFYFIKGIKNNVFKFYFNLPDTRPFLKIGIFNIGGQIINYFNKEIDILIVGNIFGTEILGGYSLAKQLVDRPLRVIRPIVMKVMAPVLSLVKNDKVALRDNYLKTVKLVSSLSFPIYFVFIVFAAPIVNLFYGIGYENIIILVRILAVYMFFVSIRIPLGSLIIATGKTNMEFYWFLITFIIMPITILIGSRYNIEGVAIAMSTTMIIYFIPMWKFLIFPLIHVELKEFIKAHVMSLKVLKGLMLNILKR